jgi:hypothetical protein
MNEKKCAVEYLGPYLDKSIQVQVKDESEYVIYKLNNVYADGTLELITEADDDTKGNVYIEFINVDNILKIAINIEDTDVELPE